MIGAVYMDVSKDSGSEAKRSYLTGVVRHYRSLFSFPGYSKVVFLTVTVATLGCISAFVIGFHSVTRLTDGLLFAFTTLCLPLVGFDIVISRCVTATEPILDLRRMAILTLATTLLWIAIVNASSAAHMLTNSLGVVQGFYLGIGLASSFRFLVLKCVSTLGSPRLYAASILPPVMSGLVAATAWFPMSTEKLAVTMATMSLLLVVTSTFVNLVNRHGKSSVGIGAIDLFRAFLANWLVGSTSPLEGYFNEMGQEADVVVKLLGFVSNSRTDAIIVVPNIHPGPFRNLGSSNLPWEIQETLQRKHSAVVMVPHGTSGHELDVTSRVYNNLILDSVNNVADFENTCAEATDMVRACSGSASATCQFMGGVALVTVTCAPNGMEDIPLEIGDEIVNNGKALGAEEVVLIDAHNCIGSSREIHVLTSTQLGDLVSAAESAIASAMRLDRHPFTMGADRVIPKEFGLQHGIGPGGIATLVVDVNGRKTAYVVIDGNNMVSGFREKILEHMDDLVDNAEVMTTDTHVVNAVSTVDRGYLPVGESIDQAKFMSYIRDCVACARSKAVASSVGYRSCTVRGIRVIGEAKLRSISLLVDSALNLCKRLAALLYLPATVVSLLLFMAL